MRIFSLLPVWKSGASGVLLLATALLTQAQTAPDIVGLRIGMSADEVVAALAAHDPDMEIDTYEASFNFFDGATLQESPAFLDFFHAKSNRTGEIITVKFAPAPAEPRVVSVSRQTWMHETPPMQAQLKSALEAKYGAAQKNGTTGAGPWLLWLQSAQTDCVSGNSGLNIPRAGTQALPLLNWLETSPGAASDGAGCGIVMGAVMERRDPTRSLEVTLSDIATWANAELAAQDWAAQLEAEAIAAREARGAAPKL